jgi:hypothetical protein
MSRAHFERGRRNSNSVFQKGAAAWTVIYAFPDAASTDDVAGLADDTDTHVASIHGNVRRRETTAGPPRVRAAGGRGSIC